MRERHVLLLILLCLLAALKWGYNPGLGRNALDGDYYYQIARHVAEGDGLVTSVSLYHQGFKELPHAINIYPLWPLLLGYSGRIIGLPLAASILPEILYLLDLVLLYLLANRLMRRLRRGKAPLVLTGGRTLDLGHVAVLLLGTSPIFFNFSSLPYTEPLALAFLFSGLLAVNQSVRGRWALWAPVAGVAIALAFLTRSQMLVALASIPLAYALAGLRRPRFFVAAIAFGVGALATIAPWLSFLRGFVRPFVWKSLIDFSLYRETPEVARFQSTVIANSTAEWWAHRLSGLRVAFDPTEQISYAALYGFAIYLLPLALLWLLVHLRQSKAALSGALESRCLLATSVFLTGAFLVGPLHLMHARFLWPWRFGHRHGLPLILLVVLALGFLLATAGRRIRTVALALVAVALVAGSFKSAAMLSTRFPSGLLGGEPELVAWLEQQSPPPTLLTTNAQALSVFSRARYHWMECREDPEKTRQLAAATGIDYVLVYAHEQPCAFAGAVRRQPPLHVFGEGPLQVAVYDVRGR